MDLQINTETIVTESDYRWLASAHGVGTAKPRTLHIASAIEAVHYPNGRIIPGTLLARYSSGANDGLWAPFVNNGATGLNVPLGIALDGFRIRKDASGTAVSAVTAGAVLLVNSPVRVKLARLPKLRLADGTTEYTVTAANITALGMSVDDEGV